MVYCSILIVTKLHTQKLADFVICVISRVKRSQQDTLMIKGRMSGKATRGR